MNLPAVLAGVDWRRRALPLVLGVCLLVLLGLAIYYDRRIVSLYSGVPYYKPGSAEFRDLFRAAASEAGVPSSWADSDELAHLVASESGGWVGRPNYLYAKVYGANYTAAWNAGAWPELWADLRVGAWPAVDKARGFTSRAIGLGQLQPANIKAYYPDGYRGVGDARNEAVGLLRYLKARHGTPAAAWATHVTTGVW